MSRCIWKAPFEFTAQKLWVGLWHHAFRLKLWGRILLGQGSFMWLLAQGGPVCSLQYVIYQGQTMNRLWLQYGARAPLRYCVAKCLICLMKIITKLALCCIDTALKLCCAVMFLWDCSLGECWGVVILRWCWRLEGDVEGCMWCCRLECNIGAMCIAMCMMCIDPDSWGIHPSSLDCLHSLVYRSHMIGSS